MTGPFSHRLSLRHGIFSSFTIVALVAMAGGVGLCSRVVGQDPETIPGRQVAPDQELSRRVTELIDELRSDQFALREEASEELFQLGQLALPTLRASRRASTDAEQSDRLDRIVDSLAKQNLESKIDSFLRGGESELENWSRMEHWFGDSPRIREMFVDLYREHPYLVESLDGTVQQRSLGLSMVRRKILQRAVSQLESPLRIDLLALLLPIAEPDFKADARYDLLIASLLQQFPATELHNDQLFGAPFIRMVSLWMAESDMAIRERVLRLALEWKLDIALRLALETAHLNPNPDLLCRCMQVIARQGKREQIALLSRFLDDRTVVYRKRYLGGPGGDVQVGDVAAASIAFLSDVPVTEIGFAEPAEHSVFGIIYEELVVPLGKSPDAAKDDSKSEPEGPPTLDNQFGQNRRIQPGDLQEFQRRMIEQEKLREISRVKIHAKALELVPKIPPKPPENS